MRKKEIKRISVKTIVIIIFSLFLLTISIGYSSLKQSLSIMGKAEIIVPNNDEYKNGNSTYNFEIINQEKIDKKKKYTIVLTIKNLDEDFKNWTVSFDTPNSYDDKNSKVLSGQKKQFKDGRLLISSSGRQSFLSKKDTLSIKLEIVVGPNEKFDITNVMLNNFKINREQTGIKPEDNKPKPGDNNPNSKDDKIKGENNKLDPEDNITKKESEKTNSKDNKLNLEDNKTKPEDNKPKTEDDKLKLEDNKLKPGDNKP